MSFNSGKSSITLDDILVNTTEADILAYYLNIVKIPCIISSPLRKDEKPSFGLYSVDGKRIFYIDLATRDSGGVFDLLGKIWNCSYKDTLERIYKDKCKFKKSCHIKLHTPNIITPIIEHSKITNLQCKVRKWRNYDIEYWKSYGISLEWLKYAEVYPISHKIIIKDNYRYVINADKYAYAYIEHKEGRVTLKIYQPFNKSSYKWSNNHDSSVISLWTKVPQQGETICICASVKDALCLWANTGIPALAIQGEGYKMSNTAISELKKRYKQVFILFDNDEPGLLDGVKLSSLTGFTNVVLPKFEGGKDIADLYYSLQDKEKFKEIIMNLFNKETN